MDYTTETTDIVDRWSNRITGKRILVRNARGENIGSVVCHRYAIGQLNIWHPYAGEDYRVRLGGPKGYRTVERAIKLILANAG